MSRPELSQHWHRVANLKARLREHARIYRHHYRGQVWYVLQDGLSTRHYRFGAGTFAVLARLDGSRSMQQIWELVGEECGEEAPTQDEVIELLTSLHQGDLLQSDAAADSEESVRRHSRERSARWKQQAKSPFYIRLPLFDPDTSLNRLSWLAGIVVSPLALLAWVILAGSAAMLAGTHWQEIGAYWSLRAIESSNLMLIVLIYPLVKGLHELAHALAVKRWGGAVHETGIVLLLLMPLPYVDASRAWGFGDKRKRMLVGAAGIIAEIALAAIATFVWLNVETGLVRDLAFNVMLIGGISTVLFNGNPLVRFDGYYVLADAIEIPNLAQRASAYYGYLLKRYLFGMADAVSPVSAAGERPWFLGYALSSFAYRVFILFAITLFVAEQHLLAGLLIGVLAVSAQWFGPLVKQLTFLLSSPALNGRRGRAISVSLGIIVLTVVVLTGVPIPASTQAQGVVWLPQRAEVRAGTDGFVAKIYRFSNDRVDAHEPLLVTEDPALVAKVRSYQWQIAELEALFDSKFSVDRVEARLIAEQLERARDELGEAQRQARSLVVPSPANGTFVAPGLRDMDGRFVRKGDVLGYVIGESDLLIRAALSQHQVARVRQADAQVALKLADRPWQTLHARVERELPAATQELPSRALGTLGGGVISVAADDADGVKTQAPVFLLDLAITDMPPTDSLRERIGMRVFVRFEHEPEPLANQWYRSLRQLLLRRLAV